MKKLTTILLILLSLSCSKEDNECKCDLPVSVAESNGNVGHYTITGIPSDCNGNFDRDALNLPDNHFGGNLTNCR